MEAVGVLFGALPLALYAIDNYHRCLQVGRDYVRHEQTVGLLKNHIFVQQEQLKATLRSVGLEGEVAPFELHGYLQNVYPEKYEHFLGIISHMDGLVKKLMDKLDIDSLGKPRWSSEPVGSDKIVWEWRRVRRSFGRRSRQRLIDELQFWNDALKACFENRETPLGPEAPSPTLESVKARFSPQSCNLTRAAVRQIHETASRAWQCGCCPHRGNLCLSWHVKEAPEPRTLRVAISRTVTPPGQCPAGTCWEQLVFKLVDSSQVLETPDSQSDATAALSVSSQLRSEGSPRQPQSRLRSIFRSVEISSDIELAKTPTESTTEANAMPRSCTTPQGPAASPVDCLCRFLQEQGKVGILTPGPLNESILVERLKSPVVPVKSAPLIEALSSTSDVRSTQRGSLTLSRKDRFGIAAAASWAVLYLAESPWLPEEWAGKQDLQMMTEATADATLYPCISSLLGSSPRGCGAQNPPQDLRSLSFRESGLVRNKTLFALGVLLIELCLNKPFEQMRQEARVAGTDDAATDYKAAEVLMQRTYLEAGDLYGYAIQRCIRFEFPGRDVTKNFEFEQFRRDFFYYVVAPVQATYQLLPS